MRGKICQPFPYRNSKKAPPPTEIVPNPVFGELDPLVARRLADLGFSDGMPVQVIAVGILGRGPFAVRLGNQSQFSLRKDEAQKVMCHVVQAA